MLRLDGGDGKKSHMVTTGLGGPARGTGGHVTHCGHSDSAAGYATRPLGEAVADFLVVGGGG